MSVTKGIQRHKLVIIIRIDLIEKQDPNHYPKALIGKGERCLNGYMNPLELQTFPIKGKEVSVTLKSRTNLRRHLETHKTKKILEQYDITPHEGVGTI